MFRSQKRLANKRERKCSKSLGQQRQQTKVSQKRQAQIKISSIKSENNKQKFSAISSQTQFGAYPLNLQDERKRAGGSQREKISDWLGRWIRGGKEIDLIVRTERRGGTWSLAPIGTKPLDDE